MESSHRRDPSPIELEVEMREVIEVMKGKATEDYMRLGNLALKINKILAISGPLLTGIAAAGSAFVGNSSWAAIVVVAAGALATTVNTFEHAGQDFFIKRTINAAISVPKLPRIRFPVPKTPSSDLVKDLILRDGFTNDPIEKSATTPTIIDEEPLANSSTSKATAKLYAILEAVADRVEMHKNVGEQRDNWNELLLNSINMITLTAVTMAGVAATGGAGALFLH
ncbi:hypothetical protein GH714_000691 [Hevea brasiliensis]|uniref:F-box protein n=1 Tax=Hevea brasiliensis TaxID=3981 RepID=A0A6A6LU55_HEVBR|nr:hypothetical protein GH714_000691 [Hevea brasiliensis]